jgi:NADH-quinone oxidoreductase subunit J
VPKREGFIKHFPIAILVAALMFIEIVMLIKAGGTSGIALPTQNPALIDNPSNLHWIAQSLFGRYMLPFEIAAVILTVALVVAILLTLRRRPGTKTQNASDQVLVRKADRVRLIKMEATTKSADLNLEAK